MELFEPARNTVQAVGPLAERRAGHTATLLPDGRVLFVGGDGGSRDGPGTAAFAPGPPMANQRYKIAGTSILLPSGNVLVTSSAQVAELLDLRSWEFQQVPGRFPSAYRFAAVAGLRDGDVLIAGGYSDENRSSAGVWRFGTEKRTR